MIRVLITILHATQNYRFTTSIFSKSQEENANQKTSPQTSKRSDRPEVASSKKQERTLKDVNSLLGKTEEKNLILNHHERRLTRHYGKPIT